MRLEVESTSYHSAMEESYDANHRLAETVTRLATSLGGCPAMAGDDLGGQAWGRAYDGVAGDLLRAGADLGGAFGRVGNLLNGSLLNHEAADCGARISGPPIGALGTGGGDPDHGVTLVSPAAPPSAAGGSGGQPEGWQWLADYLEGLIWPNADTGRMHAAGEAWLAAAAALDAEISTGAAMSGQLGLLRSPEIPVAQHACLELSGHTRDLAAAYHDVGTACRDYAQQVEEHHAEVIGTLKELLTWTVVDQVTGAILSFVTAGAAEVAAQLAEAGILARYAARIVAILRRLIELARAAAALISRGLGRIAAILARLKRFLSLRVVRAMEKAGLRSAEARWHSLFEAGKAKVPRVWGEGVPNRKGVGARWRDPANAGNGVRIDQGIPSSPWPSQRVDHVVVSVGGRIIGRDGRPIVGTLRDNPAAHIPLDEWVQWSSWSAP